MSIVSFALLEGFRSTQDGTLKLTLALNEQKPEDLAKVLGMLNKSVTLAISEQAVTEDFLKGLDEVKPEAPVKEAKTASQRLRAVLYKVWETNTTTFDTANAHYEATMEQLINHYKGKIQE